MRLKASVIICLHLVALKGLASPAANPIPVQWIARQHTELLGRAPSAAEWSWWLAYYGLPGVACDAQWLINFASSMAKSPEFTQLYPESAKAERIIALVRAAYGRDVGMAEWAAYYDPYDDNVRNWAQTVDAVYASSHFGEQVVPKVCDQDNPAALLPSNPRVDIRALLGWGASRTQASLQLDIDNAAYGTTIYLDSKEVILIGGGDNHSGLRVKAGVTLATQGDPNPRYYASMARLVPNGRLCPHNPEPGNVKPCAHTNLIYLEPGAKLRNVWVDGQGSDLESDWKLANVETAGSTLDDPTEVVENRLTDPGPDGVAIRARGYSTSREPCEGEIIESNLITGYGSAHEPDGLGNAQWVDGIAVFCESTSVRENELIDISDAGIMLYGAYNRIDDLDAGQRSIVEDNLVFSAGLSAYVALGVDPVGECESSPGEALVSCLDVPGTRSFSGSSVDSNRFGTGPRTHFDIGLMIGGKPLWGDHGSFGTGASFTNNAVDVAARVNMGVSVMGMYQTTLTANSSSYTLLATNPGSYFPCPLVNVGVGIFFVASVTSGSQASTPHNESWGCLMPHQPRNGYARLVATAAGFFDETSMRRFVPWGLRLNLDSKLLEDTWESNRFEVVSDFREIKRMGANTLRLMLQFERFVDPPSVGNPYGTPNEASLEDLIELVTLAEETGLYLVVTGLGIQVSTDQPAWYLNLTEEGRWNAQAVFWSSVAAALRERSIVLSYNVMNEPTVPDGPTSDWCPLTPAWEAFVCGCWIENITRDPGNDDPDAIAREWIEAMDNALVVGQDPDRPFSVATTPASSSFVSPLIGDLVDYITVHAYPVPDNPGTPQDELADWIDLVADDSPYPSPLAPSKPLLIEEFIGMEPYLPEFMTAVRPYVSGWISHYIYGDTPAQNAASSEVPKPCGGFEDIELGFDRIFVRDRSKYLTQPGVLQP